MLILGAGVFQTFYEVNSLSNKTSTQISWIGGLQSFLLVFVGVLSGPIYDAGCLRFLNLAGNSLVVLGLIMTSLCTKYWQVILTQGLVTGLGCGMLFVPATAVVPQYFVRRRNLASTLAAAGSGFGMLCISLVVVHQLTALQEDLFTQSCSVNSNKKSTSHGLSGPWHSYPYHWGSSRMLQPVTGFQQKPRGNCSIVLSSTTLPFSSSHLLAV